jgi:hypothetical protein
MARGGGEQAANPMAVAAKRGGGEQTAKPKAKEKAAKKNDK